MTAVEGRPAPAVPPGDDLGPDALRNWPFVDRRNRDGSGAGPGATPWTGQERRAVNTLRQEPVSRVPMTALRLGALAVGLALAAPGIVGGSIALSAWALALTGLAVTVTVRPVEHGRGRNTTWLVVLFAEATLAALAVVFTGFWTSPFIFSVVAPVLVSGLVLGFAAALRMAAATGASVAVAQMIAGNAPDDAVHSAVQWGCILVLAALVAGYTRRIGEESVSQRSEALDRLGRLAEANALLFSLHRLAQSLPSSFDLDQVLTSTIGRLSELLRFDRAVVLLVDDTAADHSRWTVARRDGLRLPTACATDELPPLVRSSIELGRIVRGAGGQGFGDGDVISAPLRARGALVGVLVVEGDEPGRWGERELELVDGLTAALALAIDNARWFARLRLLGAEEERSRIARDLHDRIGQSLTYLAFELDRAQMADDVELRRRIDRLREDLRSVIREVRDTLYDLRTDVSNERGLVSTLRTFCGRVEERAGLVCVVVADEHPRLPLPQEREVWRIASEAITNIAKHAGATRIDVTWRCDHEHAELVITDDGKGFAPGRDGRLDSYGIVGMRERAATIGAAFDIVSAPGAGTTVVVRLTRNDPGTTPEADGPATAHVTSAKDGS